MKKINIAELLKYCPKGMELYSPIFGKVYLDKIRPHLAIVVTTDKDQGNFKEEFLYDGRYGMNGECMLFPSKGKTTWEGFQRPFKDGDIISNDCHIAIFHRFGNYLNFSRKDLVYYHCWYNKKYDSSKFKIDFGIGYSTEYRFATEEEKQKLFDVIKKHGYKWNSETKTLEKLIKPKFKVGDKIRNIHVDLGNIYNVIKIEESLYVVNKNNENNNFHIDFVLQDDWELAPNNFDITTLKPFDEVLVRNDNSYVWKCNLYSHYSQYPYHYICVDTGYKQCIPYKGNEHLLGTTNDCDDYYKTWK